MYAVPYRDIDSGQAADLPADFVVDAMGRSSRLGHWLEEGGWPAPRTERMRISLGYATARFHRGDELPTTVIAHATPGPASNYLPTVCEPGALAAVEDARWSVVIAGYDGYRPGRDPEAFRARMLRCVEPLQQVARSCEMDGEPAAYHFRESKRLHYASLPRFPGGLVVMGDALASVNPIYGQGMTLATLQAAVLARHLAAGTLRTGRPTGTSAAQRASSTPPGNCPPRPTSHSPTSRAPTPSATRSCAGPPTRSPGPPSSTPASTAPTWTWSTCAVTRGRSRAHASWSTPRAHS